jgi:hypothetical protein
MKFMRWKIIAISALVLPVLTACQSAPSVLGPMNDIERSLDLSYNSSELDPKGICGTLLTAKVMRAKSQALSISRTSDIKKLNSNLELLLSRMKSVNLEKSQSADGIKSLLNSLRKIETKSENMKLYDEAAASWKNLMYLPQESYCYDWYNSLDSTPTPTSKSDVSEKGAATESTNIADNCLKLEVESPYDSADFYAFQVYITNKCSYRVSLKGYFYVKTENGAIYERPSDSIINFHGNNICGITGNYLDYTFNPGSTGEYSSDSVCNSVRSGDTVVSYFIANDPDGKPSLELNGRWTLN